MNCTQVALLLNVHIIKRTHSVKNVKEQLNDKDYVYLVGKLGDEIVSFMFAWVSDGVGNIHWLGVKPEYRKKGYAKKLMDKTIKQFTRKSCHEARVFSYPRRKGANKLFKSFGFEEKSFIDEQFFGISIILMEKKISAHTRQKDSKKNSAYGGGGAGYKTYGAYTWQHTG